MAAVTTAELYLTVMRRGHNPRVSGERDCRT